MAEATVPALRRDHKNQLVREVITPEGIPVRFMLAPAGDRAGAFVLDMLLQAVCVFGVFLVLRLMTPEDSAGWIYAAIIVVLFLLMNFYFAFFEVRWQGQTPGKRRLGIRVIDARGGQLETSAVLARNLIRELEVWTPLRFLIASDLMWPGAPTWAIVTAVAWSFVFSFMPLFNKDKLRIGDLIAGTRVVVQPKVVLPPDLVTEVVAPEQTFFQNRAPKAPPPAFEFTEKQLSIYGIYELQVLEGVLRTDAATPTHFEAVRTVAEKIRIKIRFEGLVNNDERFLRDFYAALRAHLEQKMLFGQRREDKFSK
ncbi:MAG TPA: RDD family protein [Kofleriaceae bacterium]|jgi:uncharacterized RDD family membrane protein YckC